MLYREEASRLYQRQGNFSQEDREELTVQMWQEYARKVARKTENRARQCPLKRYETCSPRGTQVSTTTT